MPPQLKKAERIEFRSASAQKEAAIADALHDLQSGSIPSIRKASEAHNVPFSTLLRHHKGTKSRHESHTHHQLLSVGQEHALKMHLEALAAQGFPMTYKELKDRAQAFHNDNINAQQAQLPAGLSQKWARGFLYRHPELMGYFSRSLDHSRTKASNATTISQYFDLLQSTMSLHDIAFCHVYNMDETGFMFGQAQRWKVILRKDQRSVTAFHTQPGQ